MIQKLKYQYKVMAASTLLCECEIWELTWKYLNKIHPVKVRLSRNVIYCSILDKLKSVEIR